MLKWIFEMYVLDGAIQKIYINLFRSESLKNQVLEGARAMQPLEEVRQGESRMYNVGNFKEQTLENIQHVGNFTCIVFYNGRAAAIEHEQSVFLWLICGPSHHNLGCVSLATSWVK